jgi:hypothetical protein
MINLPTVFIVFFSLFSVCVIIKIKYSERDIITI